MRSIFIFAHQDDEFGCYEIIRREVKLGNDVECYYLTDGGFGGQSVGRREKESQLVLAKLGVMGRRISFVGSREGLPDGFLVTHLFKAARSLLRAVGNGEGVASVFVPAWEGGHQDHDAAHIIGCVVANHLDVRGGIWQFPLYHGKDRRRGMFRVLQPLPENGAARGFVVPILYRILYLRLCLSYPSQWKTWVGLFPFVAPKLLFGGRYYLQTAILPSTIRRPHNGALLYERRGIARYETTKELLERFLAQSRGSSFADFSIGDR